MALSRSKTRRKTKKKYMEKLPREIVLDIFYRLPLESVVRCKFVCKSWRNHLLLGGDGNYFANLLLRRNHQRNLEYSTLNSIALHKSRDEEEEEEGSTVVEFQITEYDDEVEGLNCKVKRLVFSQICISGWLSMTTLVGSCNGLLGLSITYHQSGTNHLKDRRIVICNPFLGEYVTLPQSGLQLYDTTRVATGFGHNPITDEYKVVSVNYRRSSYYIGDVEVYTLGNKSRSHDAAGMWRSKGTISYRLWNTFSRYVFINGSLHWLANTDQRELNIVSFDLGDEEFRVIPLPSDLSITDTSIERLTLKELRGCLCLIEETKATWNRNRKLDIWVLKDYMNKEGQPLSYSPCAIIKKKKKKDGDGDEILCWCKGFSNGTKTLLSYDRRQVVSVLMFDRGPLFLYSNSLVSLKALGEDSKYAKNHPKTTA